VPTRPSGEGRFSDEKACGSGEGKVEAEARLNNI
jgi:hypothetical protein